MFDASIYVLGPFLYCCWSLVLFWALFVDFVGGFLVGGVKLQCIVIVRSFLRLLKLRKLAVGQLDLLRGSYGMLDHGLNLHRNIPSRPILTNVFEPSCSYSWLWSQSRILDIIMTVTPQLLILGQTHKCFLWHDYLRASSLTGYMFFHLHLVQWNSCRTTLCQSACIFSNCRNKYSKLTNRTHIEATYSENKEQRRAVVVDLHLQMDFQVEHISLKNNKYNGDFDFLRKSIHGFKDSSWSHFQPVHVLWKYTCWEMVAVCVTVALLDDSKVVVDFFSFLFFFFLQLIIKTYSTSNFCMKPSASGKLSF